MQNKFIVVRYDTERCLVPLGTAATLNAAHEIMAEDFKRWFEEKYGHEMKQRGLSYEEMFAELEGSDEFDIDETTAYINDVNHFDFDWVIINTDMSEEDEVKIVQMSFSLKSGLTIDMLREKMNQAKEVLVSKYGEHGFEVRSCHLSKEICIAKGFGTEVPDLFAEVFGDKYVSEVESETADTVMGSMNTHRQELSEKAHELFVLTDGSLNNVSGEISAFADNKVTIL